MGGDARGPEGHPIGPHGQSHAQRVAQGLAGRRRHVPSLTQPDEGRR